MIEDVAFERISSLGEPGVLVGDGTMPYPGNSRVLEVPDVAETVKETRLGKKRLLLGEAAVLGTSGLLEMADRPPVPDDPATEDVEIDGRLNDDCDKE